MKSCSLAYVFLLLEFGSNKILQTFSKALAVSYIDKRREEERRLRDRGDDREIDQITREKQGGAEGGVCGGNGKQPRMGLAET